MKLSMTELFPPTHPGKGHAMPVAGNLCYPGFDPRMPYFPLADTRRARFKTLLDIDYDQRYNPNIVVLTDSSGGTGNNTIAEITGAQNAGSADETPTENAIADLAAKVNEILGALNSDTHTLDNSGTITRIDGGIKLLTGASANNDTSIAGLNTHALADGKWLFGHAQLAIEDATNCALHFGVGTSTSVESFTAPADKIGFSKAVSATVFKGDTIENSNAAAQTGTLLTVTANAIIDLVFGVYLSTTQPLGYWSVCNAGTWNGGNKRPTAFTAAQLADIDAMMTTTSPTVRGILGVRATGAAAEYATVHRAWIGVER